VVCGDYVYDARVDRAVAGTRCAAHGAPPLLTKKRRRPSAPPPPVLGGGGMSAEVVALHALAVPVTPTLGLRAFNNLGNTCFMVGVSPRPAVQRFGMVRLILHSFGWETSSRRRLAMPSQSILHDCSVALPKASGTPRKCGRCASFKGHFLSLYMQCFE
jgi:hypothetical protein